MDRITEAILVELDDLCSRPLELDVDLSLMSWWKIGGIADLVLKPSSVEELSAILRLLHSHKINPVVIGQTTNLLFDDDGLRAPCIQISEQMANVSIDGSEVIAQAGAWVPAFSRQLMQAGLTGSEHICGIPGTLGGLVCMNGGSQRKSISLNIVSVESVDRLGIIHIRDFSDCDFSYRRSLFQKNGEIITSVCMQFELREKSQIRSEMLDILRSRRHKFPRKQPNCGSVFKSNPVMYQEIGPPGAAIESLGLKGRREGGAQVSPLHANFIVNTGSATSKDVLALIAILSEAVKKATGYRMEAEARFVRADGSIFPADSVPLLD